jgi:hypothetical protein
MQIMLSLDAGENVGKKSIDYTHEVKNRPRQRAVQSKPIVKILLIASS